MPTHTLRRIWCTKCNEFELHYSDFNSKKLICKECDTVYTDVFLKDIPFEKIKEQRRRYKEYKKSQHAKLFSNIMFSIDTLGNTEIIESDAGQAELDKIERAERDKRYEERMKQREIERAEEKKFRHLQRNDICLCGSGLKYKNCCWSRIQKIER